MRFASTLFAAAAVPALVAAYPLGRRTATDTDVLVFQFADVLEQLETQFYEAALAKFKPEDITAAGFTNAVLVAEQLSTIKDDEATHASVLEDALASFGKDPISSQCKFNFDGVLTDVSTVLATARVVENIGVTAYVGAAHLLSDPVLLSAAASIATVEARHSTVLNILSGSATVIPQAFDLALTPSEVLALAGPFISGCDLGVPANVPLTLDPASPKAGDKISFKATSLNSTVDASKFHCQIMTGGAAESISLPMDSCVVPADTNGPVAIWITSDDQPLANNVRDRDIIKQVAGPAMTFVDAKTELLPTLVRQNKASGTSSATTVTSTVSPDDAKKILDGANKDGSDTSAGDDSSAKKDPADTSAGDDTASKKDPSDTSVNGDSASTSKKDPSDTSIDGTGANNAASNVNTVSSGADNTPAGGVNEFTGETKAGGVSVVGWGEVSASDA